ncbi:hypothetical protein JTB14_032000 [Gonioctena quinquepunctata]|nr:hypothetical protein JTB14_032000 [Gonioctena quinquepunctata]
MEPIFRPPKLLRFEGNLAENWILWKQQFNLFMKAPRKDGTDVEEDIKVAIFLSAIGEEGLKVFNSLKQSIWWICSKNPKTIKGGQAFDSYLTELKNAIPKCAFGDQRSSIIIDQVIFGIRDLHVKEVLLRDGNITLEKVSEYCRAVEVSKQQIEEFQREASVNINVVKRKSVKRDVIDDCNFCGYSHRIRNCPSFGNEYRFCKKKGHFVKKCLEFSKNKKNILEIQEDESEPDDHDCREDPNEHTSIDLYVSEVRKTQIERQQVWYEYIIVNGLKIKIKLGSGAEINCLPLKKF